ncbi:hypothetical protein VP01_6513g3, partial [Puccinia sorghi]
SDCFFSPGQYLIADSGFPTKTTLVPAFKKPRIPIIAQSLNQALLCPINDVVHTVDRSLCGPPQLSTKQ